ncbi:MAG: acetyl-CoA carboxylase biotin carboxyl carrier protein subunit [Flavobacteriales bacterium]|nr:acetyl-CoA carboxylase biotin carboxyl carrier protein subunit [Flavobacteriales bacterium]
MEFEFSDNHIVSLEKISEEEWNINNRRVKASLANLSDDEFHVLKADISFRIHIEGINSETGAIDMMVNGKRMSLRAKGKYEALLTSLGLDSLSSSKAKDLKAPMPGLVLDVAVKEGQNIEVGDTLIILEAMKMENVIKAEAAGKVKEIRVGTSDSVEKNQVLITFVN